MGWMKYRLTILRGVFLILGALSATELNWAKGKYDLRFGLMLPQSDGFVSVFQETYSIERIVQSNYLHGFDLKKRGGGRFMVSYSVRFPEPLKIPEDFAPKDGKFSEGGRVYTTDGKFVWDRYFEAFSFSDTDPFGRYELSIFIDGKLYRKIEYDVEKPLSDIEFDEDLGF